MSARRWWMKGAIAVAILIVTLVGGLWGLSRSAWGRSELRQLIERQAANALNGTLTIGAVRGSLVSGATFDNVTFVHAGREALTARTIDVRFSLWRWLRGGREISSVRLIDPVIRIAEQHDNWDVSNWGKPRSGPSTSALVLSFSSIEIVNGRLLLTANENVWRLPAELRDVNGLMSLKVGGGTRIDIQRLTFATASPAPFRARAVTGALVFGNGALIDHVRVESDAGTLVANGRVGPAVPRTISIDATLDKFDAAKWRVFTPLLDTVDLSANGTLAFGGDVDHLSVRSALNTSAGRINGDTLVTSIPSGVRISGTAQVVDFDAAHVTADPQWASRITGHADYAVVSHGSPASWTSDETFSGGPVQAFGALAERLDGKLHYANKTVTFAATGTAYGASARATGTVRTADALTIDVDGTELKGLDPRNLPPEWGYTPLDADLAASAFTVHWTPGQWSMRATLDNSSAEGATLTAGTTVELAGAKDSLTVSADGNVSALDARRMGRATGLTGLDDPIFVTNLNGHVKLSGQGRSLSELDFTAQAELVDSRAAAGATVPQATVTLARKAHLETSRIVGQIVGLNPATLGAAEALASDINGAIDITASWRDDVADVAETMTARGTLRATKSVISDLPIDRGEVTGEWKDGSFTAQSATLQNSGVTLTGRGRIALTRGDSAATFEVTASDVVSLEPWTGRAGHGAATGKGVLSGAFDAPRIVSTFDSPRISDPSMGNIDKISGHLDAVFPEWVLDRMRGDLQLTAASWSDKTGPLADALSAQATFTTRMHVSSARVLVNVHETAIRATLSADWETELTADISALEARRGGQVWMLDPSSGPIHATATHLSAENAQLVNGVQRLAMSGRVALSAVETGGDAGNQLSLRATSIDLAALDAFLGVSTGAKGQISADATLVGRLSDPRGRITLSSKDLTLAGYSMSQGGGTIDLAGGAATLALSLVQPDGVTLTMNGRAPLSWVLPEGALDAAVPSPDWDLAAVSDPIKLAILGTLTSKITDIRGEAIVDLHIVGKAAAPKVTGTIAIGDGSFRVPSAGTSFEHVTADLGLGVDTMAVRRFTARDKDGHALTITGQLAVDERQLNQVNVHVEADRFTVVDNAIGTIALSSLLVLAGDATHPKLTGNVEVASGRVEVDRLLRLLQGDPLAFVAETDLPEAGTTPVDLRADAAAAAAAEATRKPKSFDSKSFLSRLGVDVQLFVPDNLIVRGAQLRPGGKNSWSLGDLNVTVGADLEARRAPGEPVKLRGDVTTVRGVYSFESRRFEIQRGGRIRFQDESPLDPTFDVRGVRSIQGVEARVDVRGRLSEPQLQLGSNVPLDEADVLSMIIFNRPVNQLGDTQRADLVGAAASLAGGFVTAPLARSIGRALDLDLLEVEAVTFGQNVAPRIRVGQQLTSRLFVQLSQQFGAQSVSELTGEYQLAKFLRLQASTAQGPGSRAQRSLLQRAERFGLDLLFFFNY